MERQGAGRARQAGPAEQHDEAAGRAGGEAQLDAARYGEVLAHLVHYEPADHPEVLARLGIAAGDWTAAQSHWTARLADEMRRGELGQATRFGQAFEQHKGRLAEARPPLESLGPLPPSAGEGAVGGEPAADGSAAAASNVDETVLGVPVVLSEPLPFRHEPAELAQARLAAQAVVLEPSDATGETQEVSAVLASRPVLPFSPVAALPTATAGQGFPDFTVEQYASLRAEICEQPERTDAILDRYGVHGAAELMALEGEWNRRRTAEPATAARLDELVQSYRAWRRQQQGGSQ